LAAHNAFATANPEVAPAAHTGAKGPKTAHPIRPNTHKAEAVPTQSAAAALHLFSQFEQRRLSASLKAGTIDATFNGISSIACRGWYVFRDRYNDPSAVNPGMFNVDI
jgi:hypothetical protein